MKYNECPFCKIDLTSLKPCNVASHIRWCNSNPKRIEQKKHENKYKKRFCEICGKEITDLEYRRKRCNDCKRKHSENEKINLSKKRLLWLKQNPEKHPWKKNNKFISTPCQNFKKYLDSINLKYASEYNTYDETNRNFSIDIAFPDIKLGIEINGNQHYNRDGTLKKYYQKRHEIIESHGWKLLEIHYLSCFKEENIKEIIQFYKQPDYSKYFNERRKKNLKKEQKIQEIKQKRRDKIEKIKNQILSSDVDFSKFGWVVKISKITGILPQKINIFMKKYLLEFYEEKCFKRKFHSEVEQPGSSTGP